MDLNDPTPVMRQRWHTEGHYGSTTVGQTLRDTARRCGSTEVVFVTASERKITSVAAVYQAALKFGAALKRRGITGGDVIAVQLPAIEQAAVAYEAAWIYGFVLVPIVHILGPTEVGFILRQTGAKALVIPDSNYRTDFESHVGSLGDTPALEHVVVVGEQWTGALRFDDLMAEPAGSEPNEQIHADDPCLVIYTSGTTAAAKGAVHSHNSFLAQMRSVPEAIERGGGPTLGVFPTGHIAGTIGLTAAFILGERHVLLETFDGPTAARIIAKYQVTSSAGTPYHLAGILDAAEDETLDVSSIGAYMTGAASVSVPLLNRAERAGISCFRGYGLTEHPEATSSSPAAATSTRFETDGVARFGTEIRVVGDDGRPLSPGQPGEIQLRGPRQSIGYLDSSRNEESYTVDEWFITGDIGHLTTKSEIVITDRKKDIINRGGEKFSAREIETLLEEMPEVREACVTSMADERLGETVRAFVIATPGAEVTLERVQHHFRDREVAIQKTPSVVETLPDFPRTASGKPRKVDLRAQPLEAGAAPGNRVLR